MEICFKFGTDIEHGPLLYAVVSPDLEGNPAIEEGSHGINSYVSPYLTHSEQIWLECITDGKISIGLLYTPSGGSERITGMVLFRSNC